MKPPRNVNSHPHKSIRLATTIKGALRIIPAPKDRIQGISKREWLKVSKLLTPIAQRQ